MIRNVNRVTSTQTLINELREFLNKAAAREHTYLDVCNARDQLDRLQKILKSRNI